MRLRVLHVTSWYPSKEMPFEALFINEHIRSLSKHCENKVFHIDVKFSNKTFFDFSYTKLSENESSLIVNTLIKSWLIKEIIVSFIFFFIVLYNRRKVDVINVHIAYPILTYFHFIKMLIKVPVVVFEHWTAYKLNFNLPPTTEKLDRIKRIFFQNIHLITVSKELGNDIKSFSGNCNLNFTVVPNVVNNEMFYCDVKVHSDMSFFMVNNWRRLKAPFVILESFKNVLEIYPNSTLRVGGHGELWDEMCCWVKDNNLENAINLIGPLDKISIGIEMRKSTAFLHATSIETFSVVCAEALCCGTPVIVNEQACIREYMNESMGVFVPELSINAYTQGIIYFLKKRDQYDRSKISYECLSRFSMDNVGKKYFNFLTSVR